jgi:BolA family transcriptional regulator, general stress-responsive regulator
MSMAARIESRLRDALAPLHLDLQDESWKHAAGPGAESHWNLVLVAPSFEGQRGLARQRAVYAALAAELQGGIHALTMKTLSPSEWEAAGGAVENPSPPCLGGSKHDG